MTDVLIKDFGQNQDYKSTWDKMKEFTLNRRESTNDEIWILEHPPVYTLGQAGKPEHILNPKNIPIVKTDRGGQVTYHGPGQIVIYFLIKLENLDLNIKSFVCKLEQGCINFLNDYGILAHRIEGAPGIYVNNEKICSIGLRVKKGCTYHGLAFNYEMDLAPYKGINPCGYKDLKMTQFAQLLNENKADKSRFKTALLNKILYELKLN